MGYSTLEVNGAGGGGGGVERSLASKLIFIGPASRLP